MQPVSLIKSKALLHFNSIIHITLKVPMTSTFLSKHREDQDGNDVKTSLIPTHNKIPTLPQSPGVSFPRSCFNTTNALTGIGVLSMPYALAQGGWLSLVFFFIIAMIFCYTGHLLELCMISNPAIRTYTDVGEVAFGYKGKLAVAIIMYFELYITAVSYLILEGDNLNKLFPNTSIEFANTSIGGKQLFVLLVGLAILPTTWLRNLAIIAYLSAVGVVASFVLFGMLVWAGISDNNNFHMKGELLNLRGLPMAMGLYAICFCGHAIFPTVYASMKDSTRFSKVLLVSYAVGTVNCGLVAICGYLMYGNDTQSQVTLNLPAGKMYTKLAIYTTLITPLTKYAWVLTPIALAIEDRFAPHNKDKPNLIARTLLVIGTIVIAITIPFFGYVMAFLGSFLGIMVSILFPCACYLKIFGGRLGKLQLAKIICTLVFGVIVCITGTYSSVKDIVNELATPL